MQRKKKSITHKETKKHQNTQKTKGKKRLTWEKPGFEPKGILLVVPPLIMQSCPMLLSTLQIPKPIAIYSNSCLIPAFPDCLTSLAKVDALFFPKALLSRSAPLCRFPLNHSLGFFTHLHTLINDDFAIGKICMTNPQPTYPLLAFAYCQPFT